MKENGKMETGTGGTESESLVLISFSGYLSTSSFFRLTLCVFSIVRIIPPGEWVLKYSHRIPRSLFSELHR